MAIIQVKELHVSFKKEKKKIFERQQYIEVLKGISFSIAENEILGLVGESGCGKTTLAKAILGLIQVETGAVIHRSKYPQMIFQDPTGSLNPSKTVSFILQEPLKNCTNMSAPERLEKVEWMLGEVGLSKEYLQRYPGELSGGQKQRVSIAQSLMLGSKFLVADEPVSSLDVTIQAQVLNLIKDLQKRHGLSILFISHDLRVVYQLCERVMIMKDGLIVESGTRKEIYKNPQNDYTKKLLKSAGLRD